MKLVHIKRELIVAGRELIYFHGTSTKFLRSILKNGLGGGATKVRVWDETSHDKESLGKGSAYLTTNFMTAYSAGGNAFRKFGGDRLIITVRHTLTQHSTAIDEDGIMPIFKQAIHNAVTPHICAMLEFVKPENRKLFDGLLKKCFATVVRIILTKLLEKKHHLRFIKSLNPRVKQMFKDFLEHLFIYTILEELPQIASDRYEYNKDDWCSISPELFDYSKRQVKFTLPEYWSAHIKPYQEKVTDFLGRFASGAKEDELERFGSAVNIRVPKVGFKGSSRIVCIAEEHEASNRRNLPDRITTTDGPELVLRYYKGDTEALRTTLTGYKNFVSGFILKDTKGHVIDHKYL